MGPEYSPTVGRDVLDLEVSSSTNQSDSSEVPGPQKCATHWPQNSKTTAQKAIILGMLGVQVQGLSRASMLGFGDLSEDYQEQRSERAIAEMETALSRKA